VGHHHTTTFGDQFNFSKSISIIELIFMRGFTMRNPKYNKNEKNIEQQQSFVPKTNH
jgi:hypothetical protein